MKKDALDEIKGILDKFAKEQERAIEKAYELGFAAGVGVTPDHEKFHKAHLEPADYGEDGEIYVLSGRYTEDEAEAKFAKYFKTELGLDSDELMLEQIKRWKIGIAADNDSEYEYMYSHEGYGGVYDAWVWTA
jgi:hypothetical protein